MAPVMSTNRFAALINDAKNPETIGSPMPTPPPRNAQVTPTSTIQEMDDDAAGPWLLAPVKQNATNRKQKNNKAKHQPNLPPAPQVPKTIPAQIQTTARIEQPMTHKFAMDCRIKVLSHESVNPARLVQAILAIFQHADPNTVLTTSMYDAKDCPLISDPSTIPITEAALAPFLSSWKKIRDDLFLCRIHMMSNSSFDIIKRDPQVLDYLKKELVIIERATLDSSDHQLVGFLVNVVPDQDSLSAQQYRFEQLLPEVPGFQLVTRKLNFKENSKLWCTVLKIRVDRADADELTLAFQAASNKSNDFQYYAFDQFTSLHPDQKRYIIETQRNFVLQNRSIVLEWNLRNVPKFVMWFEDTESNDNETEEDTDINMNESTPKRVNTKLAKGHGVKQGTNHKRTLEDSSQTDENSETVDTQTSVKKRPPTVKIYNQVDLTKVGIDDFLYSYRCGDGTPVIKYIYPEADNRREFLVSRNNRAEVNSFFKVIFRELCRHMSHLSRIQVFENPDELYHEAMMVSHWNPSGLHTMVPFSTTSIPRTTHKDMSGNKRRNITTVTPGKLPQTSSQAIHPSQGLPNVVQTPSDVGTSSSSLTERSMSTSSTCQGPNLVQQQEDLNSFKAQLDVLQQQHANLYKTVKDLTKQNAVDKLELQQTIATSHTSFKSYVRQALEENATTVTTNIQAKYMESINQLRSETQALDKRHSDAHRQLKMELSSEVTAAISALTSVVAKIEIGQTNFIQHLSSGKDQEQTVQTDQVELFLNNVKATGATIDVHPPTVTIPTTTTGLPNTPQANQSTMSSLPSTIGRVAMTTLTGLNKRGGRGGGRELRQQTLTQPAKQPGSSQSEIPISAQTHPPTSNIAPTSTHTLPNASPPNDDSCMGNHYT